MFSKAIITSTIVAAVSAHQNFHQFWVNGETPGYQVGIRMPPSNSPVTDVTSNDIACNVDGSKVPSSVETVAANEGDTIKVQWDQSTHPGPITHMLFGPIDDATQATGVGSWFKIDELDYVDGKWANEIMSAQNMTREFNLPTGLATGEYLLRSEMLALHGAQTVGGAQFYIGCAQLKITGTGSTSSCTPNIELPGAYKTEDPNIYIPNVYNGFDPTNYTAPGGPVASCGGSGSSAPVSSVSAVVPTLSANATSAALVSNVAATSTLTPSNASVGDVTSSPLAVQPTSLNVTVPSFTPVQSSAFVTSIVRPSYTSGIILPTGTSAPLSGASAGIAKKYHQCGGGFSWKGATSCEIGSTCTQMNEYYSQCV